MCCDGEYRELGVESPLVGGARLTAGNIGGEVRTVLHDARFIQPAQHQDHQQVARAELAVEPIGIAEASGKLAQPAADAIFTSG